MRGIWEERLGVATLEPSGAVEAGSYQTWTLTLTVGTYGIDERGTIKVCRRFACDMERPQFDDPAAPAYSSVSTNGNAGLAARFAPKGHVRPWQRWCIVIDVYDGSLAAGETVTLILGDRRGGSPGIRTQTFVESRHEFRVFIDPTNAALARSLPESPTNRIVPAALHELICVLPTVMKVGETAQIYVAGRDIYGNPCGAPEEKAYSWEGSGDAIISNDSVALTSPGWGRVCVVAGKMKCYSNPVTVTAETPQWRRYWGDLHAQSDATVGIGTEEEYFTFARDAARLDFASHQGNDFQMDDEDWRRLNETVRAFNVDGSFVAFPGYEWSGNTVAGGDRNVFFFEEGLPIVRSSHWQIPHVDENDVSPAHPADQLFARLKQLVPPEKLIIGSHVGGRWSDVTRYFDPAAINLVEIASCWGVFEWMLFDALEAGHVVGVMCNSDGHKGRPGMESPGLGEFGIAGGLTCVLAGERSRNAIWEALLARRCYGTTGARIDLDVRIADCPMGSITRTNGFVDVHAVFRGAGPVEALQLYRNRQLVSEVKPRVFDEVDASNRVRLMWSGSRMRGRGRRVDWSGSVRAEETGIRKATPVAFDSPADGTELENGTKLRFRSSTSGDGDGIDLDLTQARRGRVVFESAAGCSEIELTELGSTARRYDYGGLDMQLSVQRYPTEIDDLSLEMSVRDTPPAGTRHPYFIKAIQSDGHMAWSSPVYVDVP